ncbi:hypothetical protein [Amycolatopsis sp. FDAARGOS 1241]|uniref:hypothetical protein n=1 Tax=Amycolatopsis sp. FDAARGOS 1241 TaxID=2778070 RepID=UPI00194F0133|nr:hypothetical protein [Amycolatopsis sp. FDAARGOS 1241]QRP47610.1 hypothetical protein I6J71_06605 [Amycolatopsis sp. FDAARGOS 1241]
MWTSAGVAAGIDLCLHLVRLTRGADAAAAIARSMVTAPFRSGGQAQSITAPTPPLGDEPHAAVRERALRELGRPFDRHRARRLGLDVRTHLRAPLRRRNGHHAAALAARPAQRAEQLLERTGLPVAEIATCCGLGPAVSFR